MKHFRNKYKLRAALLTILVHLLAIFIFGAAGPVLLFGLLGQPTNLGFAAFGTGLCLAAAKNNKS